MIAELANCYNQKPNILNLLLIGLKVIVQLNRQLDGFSFPLKLCEFMKLQLGFGIISPEIIWLEV